MRRRILRRGGCGRPPGLRMVRVRRGRRRTPPSRRVASGARCLSCGIRRPALAAAVGAGGAILARGVGQAGMRQVRHALRVRVGRAHHRDGADGVRAGGRPTPVQAGHPPRSPPRRLPPPPLRLRCRPLWRRQRGRRRWRHCDRPCGPRLWARSTALRALAPLPSSASALGLQGALGGHPVLEQLARNRGFGPAPTAGRAAALLAADG
mmetsp:Transcript_30878/g.64727  ORF Transcript_30878/g.64727 Transcript_30878/m.64727 type:complete len:208 (+) Transcript_30878:1696-2319(+)